MAKGWIKLRRELANHWLWSSEAFTKSQAWVDLLLHANHKPAKVLIKNRLISLNVGEQARSEVTLSKQWKWSRNKVRRFLETLKNEDMIIQRSEQHTSVITICNYRKFQVDDTTGDTSNETPSGTPSGTLAEHQTEHQTEHRGRMLKNEKNEKNIKNIPSENSSGAVEKSVKPKKSKSHTQEEQDMFERFWNSGIKKAAKAKAEPLFYKIIRKEPNPEGFTEKIVLDIQKRIYYQQLGFDKMHPTTYLNQSRWDDVLDMSNAPAGRVQSGEKSTRSMTLEEELNRDWAHDLRPASEN